ncbi:MAG: hypothetical protein JETCAE04_06150 [Candidatus Jettenia caeni]|nr:MAG: hypothetical protein JETCAE04_06150 [Candidatus Jettenia caeni]
MGLAGVEVKGAVKKAATWNTAVTCGANDGILLLPTTLKREAEIDLDDSLGNFFTEDGTPGAVKVSGDIPCYLRYDGNTGLLLALFMGIAGVPTLDGTTKSVTSITRTSTTATATVSSHGYTTGDVVTIAGATQSQYNGTFTITVIDTNSFTYTVTGSPTTPATGTIVCRKTTTGVPAYNYIYKWNKIIDGLFCTFCLNMKDYIEEAVSVKVVGFTLKGDVGNPLQIIFHVIANNKEYASIVNTTTTFNNVTYVEKSNRVRFSEGVFRINDKSGAGLAAGDKVYPSAFELKVMRKLEGVYTGQYLDQTGTAKQELIDEPQNAGMPEVSLTLTFPRHTSTTYLTTLINDTRKKMDITFTGALIEGASYRSFKLQFPHLQLKNDNITEEPGIIKEPLEFLVQATSDTPLGMGITDPFWISGTNRRNTDPLV